MEDAGRIFGRFTLKSDDEIAFVMPGEDEEHHGIVIEITDLDDGPALTAYLPGFPYGDHVTVRPEEVRAKILYSNAGLARFEVAEKVEYWDEEARRVSVAWVYEIDTANREIILMARGKVFSRLPEELRVLPPPRMCEHRSEGRTEAPERGEE